MAAVLILTFVVVAGAADEPKVAGACMTCHKEKSPGLYRQWFDSQHAAHNVTCLSCHQAQPGDKDAFAHYDATITTLVTPLDCGRCHPRAAEEVGNSYHASARYDRIDATVGELEDIWARNVHPGMKIEWGAYPSFLGHRDSPGCFRCHTRELQDGDSLWIPDDCTLCHSILAFDENEAFAYLKPAAEKARNRPMHEYLREEFLTSTSH